MSMDDMTIDWVENIGRGREPAHIRLRSYWPRGEDNRRSLFACGELGTAKSWRPGFDAAAERCPTCTAIATALGALVRSERAQGDFLPSL